MTHPPPVYAVLGRPVGRSRSPELHRSWLAALGLPGTYVALEVPEGSEGDVVRSVRALGLAGCNVTVPLKQRVAEQVDALAPTATVTGAVNTLVWEGTRLVGHNTDVEGCTRALVEAGLSLSGARLVVVGTGGAARAAIEAALAGGAAEVGVWGRDEAAVVALTARSPRVVASRDLSSAEIVIHATSGRPVALVAATPESMPHVVGWMDLNYWDPDPPGRAAVLARGAVFVEGWPMLCAQAAASFRLWTGVDPLQVLRPPRTLVR